jgi:hypothetical protein
MSSTGTTQPPHTDRPFRRPSSKPIKVELKRAAEEAYAVLLKAGSAWETIPWAVRKPLLDHAFNIEALLARYVNGGERYRGDRRPESYAVVRHPGVDLNALGVPDPIPTVGRAAE